MALPVHRRGHRRLSVGSSARARCCGPRCRCSISARRPQCWRRCWSAGRACWPEPSTRARCGTRYASCGAVGFRRCGRDGVDAVEPAARSARRGARPPRSSRRHPIAADMYRDIEQRYHCRIVTMYGMTEAFPLAYKAVSDEGVPGTSGRVNPNFEVRIVDLHGKPVPERVGEIACRARTPHAMSEGYVSSASGRRICRSIRIRSGSAPAISASWTSDDNLTTSTGSRTRCEGAARTSPPSKSNRL